MICFFNANSNYNLSSTIVTIINSSFGDLCDSYLAFSADSFGWNYLIAMIWLVGVLGNLA